MISGGDRNQAGYVAKKWKDRQLDLLDLDRIEAIADILSWIDTHVKSDEPAIIAVDAPTLIPNAGGMRLPDKLTHKYFGKYHAGCYPANLSLPFAERTVKFGLELEARGFTHFLRNRTAKTRKMPNRSISPSGDRKLIHSRANSQI